MIGLESVEPIGENPFWLLPVYHEKNRDSEALGRRIHAALVETGFERSRLYVDEDGFPAEDWRKEGSDAEVIYPKGGHSFGYQSPVRPEMFFEVNAVISVQGDDNERQLTQILSDVGGGHHGYPC